MPSDHAGRFRDLPRSLSYLSWRPGSLQGGGLCQGRYECLIKEAESAHHASSSEARA